MNNDLKQFSEERLIELANENIICKVSWDERVALGRIALKAKNTKAIGYVESKTTGTDRFILKGFYAQNINIGDSLYTTPQPAHTEQDGWKLVPIEPTQEMVDAHMSGMQSAGFSRAYRDMLAAAPKPESE